MPIYNVSWMGPTIWKTFCSSNIWSLSIQVTYKICKVGPVQFWEKLFCWRIFSTLSFLLHAFNKCILFNILGKQTSFQKKLKSCSRANITQQYFEALFFCNWIFDCINFWKPETKFLFLAQDFNVCEHFFPVRPKMLLEEYSVTF